ncbi:hypothetical protein SLE2022_372740 [Rubroshorea leprosula]
MKSEEPNDSMETIIRQTMGKDSFTPFQRPENNTVQWIQLLQALDHQDLPGWPLLTPLKVQMQKCDKCSREFCSPINYRRHMRVHHRLKKLDKDSANNRDLLGAFWDKLSVEEAKEVVSFKNVTLEEVPGSSVIKALTTLVRKSAFPALPQVCLRAGYALLDIIQARSSRFPISSQELFSILDDASERTFLCGMAVSMQKYVFNGEAGKIGLETKNLIACTCFLLEQKLVKAWLADKDAEALRCQKLLVEEEEAAQKRQAELLERKRKKKLRQKEQRAREQRQVDTAEVNDNIGDSSEVVPPVETSSPSASSDQDRQNLETLDEITSSVEPVQLSKNDEDVGFDPQMRSSDEHDAGRGQDVERQMVQGGHQHIVSGRRLAPPRLPPRLPHGISNGSHAGLSFHSSKVGGIPKHATIWERPTQAGSGNKMWSQKSKPVNDVESLKIRAHTKAINQPDQEKPNEVLIGSIPVTLDCERYEATSVAKAQDCSLAENQIPKKNNLQEKSSKPDSVHSGNRSTGKFWRPVSRGSRNAVPANNGSREFQAEVTAEKGADQSHKTSLSAGCPIADVNDVVNKSLALEKYEHAKNHFPFDRNNAKEFLDQRWKAALEGGPVILNLSSDGETPRNSAAETESSDLPKSENLGITDHPVNRASNAGVHEAPTGKATQAKFRAKLEKGAKLKYVPKRRIST